jgi:cell wall-associated NlpC family hydrolase
VSALDRALTQRVVELARSSLRAPYRRSGESRRGFDCSGLTSWVYRQAGTVLPRTTGEQAAEGRWVGLDELRAGDLVFFGASRRSLSHVGIVVSEPYEPLTMIHAASSHGVVETVVVDSPYWLSRLQLGRRVAAG